MCKIYYCFLGLFLQCFYLPDVSAQEWQEVGDVDGTYILELYPDTITDRLYVGGNFKSINNVITRNVSSFDGTQFEKMTDSTSINLCWNLGCRGVVSITRYHEGIVASLVRTSSYEAETQIIGIGSWDGEQWTPLDGGISDEYSNSVQQYFPATAYDFCTSDDTLYVAGYITIIDSLPGYALGAWDGTQWHTYMQEPGPGEFVLANSIAKYKGNIYLGGNILLNINGEEVRDLVRYNGTSWNKVGDALQGFNTNLHDMEVFQDKLYVAGYFTQADGNPGNSIMSWDGEQWDDLSGGICDDGIIDDLFVYEDKLYVAGLFDCIGDIEAHNVAVWDGTKWCSIGHSVFNGPVNTIAVWRDTIYVGGGFYEINGQSVRYLARFVGDLSSSICSEPVLAVGFPNTKIPFISIYPNPASNILTISMSGVDQLCYEVVDLLGRQWWSCADCPDRQEIPIAAWPAGSYVVRAVGEEGVAAKGFVKR